MIRPASILGMAHVALVVHELEACRHFYTELLGMRVEWEPDSDNVYLTSGGDNLALHRANPGQKAHGTQRLDHIGFFVERPEQVDEWFTYLRGEQVVMKTKPRTHRDGARSFYCEDPDGTVVQVIYHPPIVKNQA